LAFDLEQTTRTIIGLGLNPNVGAVLLVSLGCENVPSDKVADEIAKSGKMVEKIVIQELGGVAPSLRRGVEICRRMVQETSQIRTRVFDASALCIGTKCGSSDTTNGIASNPAVGVAYDAIMDVGGTGIFGETTEMMGTEHILARRAVNELVGKRIHEIVARMEERASSMGVDIRGAQPGYGNIKGGISTIEEKSLGAILKGGTAPIQGVLEYSERPQGRGLFIMDSPGREIEMLTGIAAAGAQMIVFATGRGALQGFPIAPVIKVTGNSRTVEKLGEEIDVDVSSVTKGRETIEAAGQRVLDEVLEVAGGKQTKSEALQLNQCIDIWRIGPTI
jgi:altronate dehydratase large subunit